ncbi:DNA polymerase alpha/epsilon subunit B-domain-containing protein [Fennellomyces sp. T-0311]|nr:DNA polymerase alpha/epsilon subunit B-domain-containing protein [Fennellomyces sp. T-0311]
MSVTERELAKALSFDEKAHHSILVELVSLCRIYNLSSEALKYKWEAVSLNSRALEPTIDLVHELKQKLQREFEQKLQNSQQQQQHTAQKMTSNKRSFDMETDLLGDFMTQLAESKREAPVKSRKSDPMDTSGSVQQPQVSLSAAPIKAIHAVEESYNGNLALRGPVDAAAKRTKIDNVQSMVKDYRYMFEKIKDRADVLDEQIEYLAEFIPKDSEEDFGNPTRSNQGRIFAVGRICSDASEGKLNDKSVMLETSRDIGMGRRIRLDLGKIQNYALFPGQIVGVEGTNNTGRVFTAERVITPQLPAPLDRSGKDLNEYHQATHGKPIEIIVSAGPYTLDSDLSYQPLRELLKACTQQKPDILLLLGPFVSEKHPAFANGMVDASPEEFFQKQIANQLSGFASECPGTRVILMPHADDLIHQYPVFPQPSLSPQVLELSGVEILSNPAVVSINGVVFAVGNIDICKELAKEEAARTSTDGRTRQFEHVLQQHSFYPLFPHAATDSIDADRVADIQISIKPDILIMPSQLKRAIKSVDRVICVNPGQLAKPQTTGTYARFTIHSLPKMPDGVVDPIVQQRTRVDLVKL